MRGKGGGLGERPQFPVKFDTSDYRNFCAFNPGHLNKNPKNAQIRDINFKTL